jgi:hypothetical protein
MRKFEFKQTYEEVEVAGKVYRVDFSDDKIKYYQKEMASFLEDANKLKKAEKTTEAQQLEHFENMKKLVERALETILGEGTFDELYEASGRSIMNVIDFVWYLYEIVQERKNVNREEKRKKYVKKKK